MVISAGVMGWAREAGSEQPQALRREGQRSSPRKLPQDAPGMPCEQLEARIRIKITCKTCGSQKAN